MTASAMYFLGQPWLFSAECYGTGSIAAPVTSIIYLYNYYNE